MKYCVTFRQYADGKEEPLTLAKILPSAEKLKFYLDVFENCGDTFELISIVPVGGD